MSTQQPQEKKIKHELVLCVNRADLTAQGVGEHGVYPINLGAIRQSAYGLLNRESADEKSIGSVAVGTIHPQFLGYIQIQNSEGKYLAYQRKGKEEGLTGMWSIGVGGHVNHMDFYLASFDAGIPEDEDVPVPLNKVLMKGIERELKEEVGLPTPQVSFEPEDFGMCLSSNVDKTSAVHVGLVATINLHPDQQLTLDPKEFLNVRWLSEEELIREHFSKGGFETWSALLISRMAEKYNTEEFEAIVCAPVEVSEQS